MIRVRLAAALIRSTGGVCEYRVRRIYNNTKGQGTTVLRTQKFGEAKRKYNAMRIADTDVITITVEAVVAQRHGTVEANKEVSNGS